MESCGKIWQYVTTSNSIQDGGALVVNILVFDLRVQLQHCTYQRKTLLFALIKVSIFICKMEISGFSSPLTLTISNIKITRKRYGKKKIYTDHFENRLLICHEDKYFLVNPVHFKLSPSLEGPNTLVVHKAISLRLK